MNHKVIAANARVWPRVCVNPHRLFSGPYLCPDMPFSSVNSVFQQRESQKELEFRFIRSMFFCETKRSRCQCLYNSKMHLQCK